MSDLMLEAANETNAIRMFDFQALESRVIHGGSLAAWNILFVALSCLYAVSRTSFFPDKVSEVSPLNALGNISRERLPPYAHLRRYPMLLRLIRQRQLAGVDDARSSMDFGTVSALLDIGAEFTTDEDVASFCERYLFRENASISVMRRWQIIPMRNRLELETRREGFRKFLNLSVDIRNFIDHSDAPGEILECFAGIYIEALKLLSALETFKDVGLGRKEDGWFAERMEAVGKLSFASIDLVEGLKFDSGFSLTPNSSLAE